MCVLQMSSFDASAQRRSQPVKRPGAPERYSSLTEGVITPANNGALASHVSSDVIASARAKLRQNSTSGSTDTPTKVSARFGAGGNSSTHTLLTSSRAREGDASTHPPTHNKQSEANNKEANKKQEISVEMQYFINRNKSRAMGSRSFDAASFATGTGDIAPSQPVSDPKPDPVYSGRTYGVTSSRDVKSVISSREQEAGQAVPVDKVKATSRLFDAKVTPNDASSANKAKRPSLSELFSSSSMVNFSNEPKQQTGASKTSVSARSITVTSASPTNLTSRSLSDFSQSASRTQQAQSPPSQSTPNSVNQPSNYVPPPPAVAQATGRSVLSAINKQASAGGASKPAASQGASKTAAASKKTNSRSRFEPKLDPREELMIAIRNAGRGGLKQVRAVATSSGALMPI